MQSVRQAPLVWLASLQQDTSKLLEEVGVERLGEDVCDLLLGRDPLDLHLSSLQALTNEVVFDVDVLGPCADDGVLRLEDGALVVDEERDGLDRKSELTQ